jgi:hypothetical protein
VVISAVRLPLGSGMALVAMVVACRTSPISAGHKSVSRKRACSPSSTARAGSREVVGTVQIATSPVRVSRTTKSVKVPPISKAIASCLVLRTVRLPLGAFIATVRVLAQSARIARLRRRESGGPIRNMVGWVASNSTRLSVIPGEIELGDLRADRPRR